MKISPSRMINIALAAILLACSYAAIGLFVSSRTDNQIVALMATVLICGVFYLLGSSGITDLLPDAPAQVVKSISTSSRFESIERDVIDLRDLVYYLTLTAVFLVLNIVSLDRIRWSTGSRTLEHRQDVNLISALLIINLIVVNVWMYPLRGFGFDICIRSRIDNIHFEISASGDFVFPQHVANAWHEWG